MFNVRRNEANPFIISDNRYPWRQLSTFNPSPAKIDNDLHLLYRAMTDTQLYHGQRLSISSIGHALAPGGDLKLIKDHKQLLSPEEDWELFGCEDPRVTKVGNEYYIFYTAISEYPFKPEGIRVAVAKTKDFKSITERHLVTPFNAKAMVLLPEKVNGKWTVMLTVNSDMPPAHTAIASFDNLEQIWDQNYWQKWYTDIEKHSFDLRRKESDHIEIGAVPILTNDGWLVIYSHIQNYFSDDKIFGIEAILLDKDDLTKIIGRTKFPFMVPEESYEQYGQLPNIVFPSGSLLEDDRLTIFYGACDTVCAAAEIDYKLLQKHMFDSKSDPIMKRYENNPILSSIPKHNWENKYTFNPTAIEIDGNINILYRAMGDDMTSVIGLAQTKDGFKIDRRLDKPIYTPRANFENKQKPDGFSGCEDARIVRVGDRLYITYTAYNGVDVPAVASSNISVEDFKKEKWDSWTKPVLISPGGIDDKDSAIFPEKIKDQYMVLHRIDHHICGDFVPDLDFEKHRLKRCIQILGPRKGMWDSEKIGIAGPPEKTDKGWLLFYHGITSDKHYCLGAALLDLEDPSIVIGRSSEPLLIPEEDYEKYGWIENVVFPCGQVIRDETVYIYYGGADQVVAVATAKLSDLLDSLA